MKDFVLGEVIYLMIFGLVVLLIQANEPPMKEFGKFIQNHNYYEHGIKSNIQLKEPFVFVTYLDNVRCAFVHGGVARRGETHKFKLDIQQWYIISDWDTK